LCLFVCCVQASQLITSVIHIEIDRLRFPLLFFVRDGAYQDLNSFPTRRSSDLNYQKKKSLKKSLKLEGLRWGKMSKARTVSRFLDRKSTRLNSSHVSTSYAVFCLKKKIEYSCSTACATSF